MIRVVLYLSNELETELIRIKPLEQPLHYFILEILKKYIANYKKFEEVEKIKQENEELKKQVEELKNEIEKKDADIQLIINEKIEKIRQETIKETKEKIKLKLRELADRTENQEIKKVYLDLILVISQL